MSPDSVRILVADDEANIVSLLKKVLGDEKYNVFTASTGAEACLVAEREQVHLALLDLILPDMTGIEVLKCIREKSPTTRVFLMTAFATAETAVEAMKLGALDYLIKPFSIDEIRIQVRRAIDETALGMENLVLRHEIARREAGEKFVGESPVIRDVLETAKTVGRTEATILVLGESGTGKELIARAIHAESLRRAGPFLAINCGAIPENLLERELFGNEKGAFTGADQVRPGLLEAASDGTLFLDEISEMPPPLQVKLLRVLEGLEFLRLGGTRPIRSRARFLAATNQDIPRLVADGKFRQDLFYRLNVISIILPPLRDRAGDVPILADHFVNLFSPAAGKRLAGISPDAVRTLSQYNWPGNVRELRNVIERAVILCRGNTIETADLRLDAETDQAGPAPALFALPHRDARDGFEKEYIARALATAGGNITRCAEAIGLDRKNLQDKIRKYGLKV